MKATTTRKKSALSQVTSLKARANKLSEHLSEFTSNKWSAEVYSMTPPKAREILTFHNCNKGTEATNRTLKKRNVNFLSRAISEDGWKRHAGNIKFDTTGTLIDGQHRLNAIAESGKILEVIVEKGCDAETTPAIDQGDNRTLTHAVQFGKKLKGLTPKQTGWFTTRAVQILRSIVNIEGKPVAEGTLSERSKGYSANQVVEVINDHKSAMAFVFGNKSKKKGFTRPAILGPIISFISEDWDKGVKFYNDFIGIPHKGKSNAGRMLGTHLERVNNMKERGEKMSLGVYSSRGYDEMLYWHRQTLKAIESFKSGKNIKFRV
tara:strand:- start:621 stop:1580 length:960 start_codon:yes stop_codon:yes gene_type:complete